MNVKMAGIDYTAAEINIRQCFSFTKKAIAETLEKIKKNPIVKGCAILSTCNRMEVWLSLKDGATIDLPKYICDIKKMSSTTYRRYLKVREGKEAVQHLFFLSAGMKSQIVGEDQILTQVKEAAAFSREQECMDHVLEVLFRMAITAGKQVKTEVPMDKANFSAAHQAIHFLKEQGIVLSEKKALVIGNGEMGKITAQALMEEGADVTVTVRQYRSGVVNIPQGAKRMNYGERYQYIPECDLIFSATASPNFTITKECLEKCLQEKKQIYVDLAVPRDMEESIEELETVQMYDMDSFHVEEKSKRMKEQYQQAEEILKKHIQAFYDWQESRDLVPRIQKIGLGSGQDACWRMEKDLKGLEVSEEEKDKLRGQIRQTTGKVVDKLLFTLRNQVDTDTLRQCIEIMEQVYEEK